MIYYSTCDTWCRWGLPEVFLYFLSRSALQTAVECSTQNSTAFCFLLLVHGPGQGCHDNLGTKCMKVDEKINWATRDRTSIDINTNTWCDIQPFKDRSPPLRGQSTWTLSRLSPKRHCSLKRDKLILNVVNSRISTFDTHGTLYVYIMLYLVHITHIKKIRR